MTCRGFQFKEGETYEEQEAKLCEKGFHACENPLDCWGYYNMIDGVFHEVELEGVTGEHNSYDTKVCAKKIKIGARLDMRGIVKASVDFVMESVKGCFDKKVADAGDYAKIGSSGNYAKIGSSGDSAQIGSSGNYAKIGSSGDYAQIGSSGDSAQIGSSGYSAKIGSSGDYAKIGSSGDYAKIGSSGDYAKIGSSGYSAQIDITGERSIGACVGNDGMIKAKKGCWIVQSEWKIVENTYTPVCVKAVQVDGEMIKEDTWYKLKNGELVEA